jgi:regulation of enolase protein 1 (concanavalin A-like superfamily)
MLKPLLVIGDIESANELVPGVLQSDSRSWWKLARTRGVEMLYRQFGHQDAFRQICQQFKRGHSEALQKLSLTQLCLEPAQPSDDYGKTDSLDVFDGDSLAPAWEWIDPTGDCNYKLLPPSGLQITARHDWYPSSNCNAPRLLRSISGDFAIETKIYHVEGRVNSGGLLVWKDEDNYLRFEMRSNPGEGEVRFEGKVQEIYLHPGRGYLETKTLILRLERQGHRFCAYCSVDGENWLTCGWVDLPMDDPIQVGIHALCATPLAISTRFEYFKVLRREE